MKKFLFLIAFTLCSFCLHAQSTNTYYEQPVRFELVTFPESRFHLVVDTQLGIVKCVYRVNFKDETFYINDKDLTNGTPTRDGRFRILWTHNGYDVRMIDTEDGRCWIITLNGKQEKTSIQLINDSMIKK